MAEDAKPCLTSEHLQLLRAVQDHHSQLGANMDLKASALLVAAILVLTIVFSGLVAESISLTMFVLGVFMFTSAILAVMAITPRVRPHPGRAHRLNLLFYGTFSQLSEREFTESLTELLHSEKATLEAVIRDLYQQGTSLYLKKCRYLVWSFRALLAGLIGAGTLSFFEFAFNNLG